MFFQHMEGIIPLTFGISCAVKKSAVSLIVIDLETIYLFSLAAFINFSFSLVFCSFIIMCLGVRVAKKYKMLILISISDKRQIHF